ncbi:MAG: hypothetical protein NPIRA04_35520 [Nitrospirales bacterium]|nr:MAG: hypothetical protein NPIRA04_35520 [Nitrospirales bacterium]
MNEKFFIPQGLKVPSTMVTNQGSSLLEVLMAMVLVSVVILGISGFSTVSIHGMTFSQKMTIAATLAQDQLEDIRRIGYRPSVSGVVTSTEPYGSMKDTPFFQRTVVLEAQTPGKGLQTVTVTVTWDAGSHSTSFSTMLAE